ncbi:MAG: folylpolyglutamate synthase/dihydrofolate synthase family protein [Lachnospiraceae bacterium]
MMKTYEEILERILEIPRFTTKNTPEHTREFMKRLGNPQEEPHTIHVAGSNGKGSVCADIASVLRENGKRVGLFTSPHLVKIEERFQVDGIPCTPQEFTAAALLVQKTVDNMVSEGLPHPTFFEYIYAIGMIIFQENKVDYAVVETGLGGRLDATNCVKQPQLTVITSISLEHTELLGDTIEKIAAEKAGILKPGVPIVYDACVPEASKVIEERAISLGCARYPVNPKNIKILLNTGRKIDFSYESNYDVTKVSIPFGAPYQARNAAVALQAVNIISQTDEMDPIKILKGFKNVQWKGRMQEVMTGVYLDGAHNVSGIDSFLEAAACMTNEPSLLLFSMVQEKKYLEAVKELVEKGNWEEIIITQIPNARGLNPKILLEAFEKEKTVLKKKIRVRVVDDLKEAFTIAIAKRKQEQMLFCAGSLYLIGELERITGGMKDD